MIGSPDPDRSAGVNPLNPQQNKAESDDSSEISKEAQRGFQDLHTAQSSPLTGPLQSVQLLNESDSAEVWGENILERPSSEETNQIKSGAEEPKQIKFGSGGQSVIKRIKAIFNAFIKQLSRQNKSAQSTPDPVKTYLEDSNNTILPETSAPVSTNSRSASELASAYLKEPTKEIPDTVKWKDSKVLNEQEVRSIFNQIKTAKPAMKGNIEHYAEGVAQLDRNTYNLVFIRRPKDPAIHPVLRDTDNAAVSGSKSEIFSKEMEAQKFTQNEIVNLEMLMTGFGNAPLYIPKLEKLRQQGVIDTSLTHGWQISVGDEEITLRNVTIMHRFQQKGEDTILMGAVPIGTEIKISREDLNADFRKLDLSKVKMSVKLGAFTKYKNNNANPVGLLNKLMDYR